MTNQLHGVIPALVTPIDGDDRLDLEVFQRHVGALAALGCHGFLVAGSTGEAPSLTPEERLALFAACREAAPEGLLIAGTGCAGLPDTLALTRQAFQQGVDAALVVPPFYFKGVSTDGLEAYYRRILEEAVPEGGRLLLYHIPQLTHVPIPFKLLERLSERYPAKLVGVKDSSGDPEHLFALLRRFPNLRIFSGSDRLLLQGLQRGAAGCIIAGANLYAPLALEVYAAFRRGQDPTELQEHLSAARATLERFAPFPPALKSILARHYGGEAWHVRPPLMPLTSDQRAALRQALNQAGMEPYMRWLAPVR
jgi:4-hydroxy-tetrahydrodipicolinate synthase